MKYYFMDLSYLIQLLNFCPFLLELAQLYLFQLFNSRPFRLELSQLVHLNSFFLFKRKSKRVSLFYWKFP